MFRILNNVFHFCLVKIQFQQSKLFNNNSYHFSKFHSIDGYTGINLQPIFLGFNMKSGRGTYIIRNFKQNVFIIDQWVVVQKKHIFLEEIILI